MDDVIKESEDCSDVESTLSPTRDITIENSNPKSGDQIEEVSEESVNKSRIEIEAEDVPSTTSAIVVNETEDKTENSLKIEDENSQTSPNTKMKTVEIETAKSDSIDFKIPKVPNEKANVKSSTNDADPHAEHVTYSENGTAIYTDPKTKYKYIWSDKENTWMPYQTENVNRENNNPYENEHYKWCSEKKKWIPKNTQITETEHYKWDAEKNEWIPKQKSEQEEKSEGSKDSDNDNDSVTYGIDENGQRIYTDKDGAVFFWDEEKSAWFPKIDDDFMAKYQMSYGFIDNVSAGLEEKRKKDAEEEIRKAEELERMSKEARAAMEDNSTVVAGTKRKAAQDPPKWFDMDPAHNTKVYVSNLPLDITLDEFGELMGKCGMIMRDPKTQKFKLKLYAEADGQIKGDGLCDYIKVESVNLALKILDESIYRGNKIRVQPAKFQMRGEYNPALKPKRKKKDKEKMQKLKERLFDWRPEKMRGERTKNEKIVIITNLFIPELFEKDVQLILDYQNDLREECSKCGTVRKVIIYDRHADGVAQINMSSPEEADLVIQMMNGRYFGKRQLSAEHWDGKTKYKIAESEQEVKDRLSNWEEYLEQGENDATHKDTQK